MSKKVLIVGSGGREHALAWKLAQSNLVEKIFVAPGNGGTAKENKCENVPLHTIEEILQFAKNNKIDQTIIGPEAFLVEGIADEFQKEKLSIFGPTKSAAQLEGSKVFAKEFMAKHGVRTAKYRAFKAQSQALEYLNMISFPIVIKANGLAGGKGVLICQNRNEAEEAITNIMVHQNFGKAGNEVVIEEFLYGFEVSILSLCDGKTIIPFVSAKDHKKIGENDTGLNTGGMGVIASNPDFSKANYDDFITSVLNPTLHGLQEDGIPFVGVLFFGLMVSNHQVYLLEYNVRFGDPETQATLPLLESDLYPLIESTIDQNLSNQKLDWSDDHSCCVVLASKGYPGTYETGKEITLANDITSQVFIAGAIEENNTLITSGGRVLSVVSCKPTLREAHIQAYQDVEKISFEGEYYRKDIGGK